MSTLTGAVVAVALAPVLAPVALGAVGFGTGVAAGEYPSTT
jgi:hypothetical protein